MNTILFIIILAIVVIAYRIYRVKTFLNKLKSHDDLKFILPLGFYLEQSIALFSLSLFLFALDPVPALYAVLAVVGIIVDTILTAFYYSSKHSISTKINTA